jgi:hypothetical protein
MEEVRVMGQYPRALLAVTLAVVCLSVQGSAAGQDAALQGKLSARAQTLKAWAASPAVVAAVKALNAKVPDEYAAVTEATWAELSVLDPFVRSFTKNEAALSLKANKPVEVSEAFVSAANGMKVAFLSKTTSWSHKGKPKHEVPMSGKTWQGQVEVDKSTGQEQIQLAVPIMDGSKPIGSLVVGLAVSKLR